MPRDTGHDAAPASLPPLDRALLAGSAALVAGGWLAPVLGAPSSATSVAVTLACAFLMAFALRVRRRPEAMPPEGGGPSPSPEARRETLPVEAAAWPIDGAIGHSDAGNALWAGEALLRSVIDGSPDGIKVLQLDGTIGFINRSGLCLLECHASESPVGRDFVSLWPEEARETVRFGLSTAAVGAWSRFSAHCWSARGNPLDLDVLVSPIPGRDGRPERLLVVARDVTADALAQARLRVVQDRYRLLAEHSSDVVMLRPPGPHGRALYVSPSALRVLGHTSDHVAEAYPGELVHPDDRAAVAALIGSLVPADGTVLHTHRVPRPDGTIVWIEGAFHAAERGGETTVVVALRDVTERQLRTEDLAAAKDMAERAQRSAEQASEAKSDFLAAMSHEIRTPLNSIIGFTDLMLDAGDLPEGARQQAELIQASGAALLTVVNDVLDFSKVEAGAVELEAIPFGPADLANQCAAILRGYAGTKAIAIGVDIDPRVSEVLVGDEARLRQVLLNLLNNAVKFTPSGTVTLRLSLMGGSAAGETIRFEVADTGIGIAEGQQHRLFERFSQVDSSVARRFGGSGLGLAICKKLVDLMGGSIGVTSRLGAGSTFWFSVTLPRGRTAPLPLRPRAASPAPSAGNILLVEDIDINQRLAVALLEAAGHRVEVVDDGAKAVAAVASKAYDLVLMDVQMPGMDGIAATRAIRGSAGAHRDVPIVAMTANVFPEQVRAFREAGMDGHVGKPLNRAQLGAAVTLWVGRGGPDRVPPAAAGFDDAVLRGLERQVGAAPLDDILAGFAASLAQRFAGLEDDGAEAGRRWRTDAHVVLSMATMTGFAGLAARCRALEEAPPGSEAQRVQLVALRQARDEALAWIAEIRRRRAGMPGPGAGENAARPFAESL